MKLYFYRGSHENFGDELNLWLMPKVFPNFFDEDASTLFLAIGSIILDGHPKDARKIVFGSGYAGYSAMPTIDDTWKFYGVRGAKTAEACGLGPEMVVGDTAILINRYVPKAKPSDKQFKFSFMPHWQSVDVGSWQRVCRWAGVNFIDPRQSVDTVLDQLQKTEVLITEAMHGAIVGDALRIPWIAITPAVSMHRQKWLDWASALDLELNPIHLGPSTAWEAAVAGGLGGLLGRVSRFGWLGTRIVNVVLNIRATRGLKQAMKAAPQLSSDAALERCVQKLERAAEQVKRDFA